MYKLVQVTFPGSSGEDSLPLQSSEAVKRSLYPQLKKN